MPRGGKRPGAGAKPKWRHGKTKVIRVPEAFADQLLEIAQHLDGGLDESVIKSEIEIVTESKTVNLSGVLVRSLKGEPVVYLSDLIRIGYQILPDRLARSVKNRARRDSQNRIKPVQHQLDIIIPD